MSCFLFETLRKKLISVWPIGPILDSETSNVTNANVAFVTDGLGIRLKTPMIILIPPHNIAMIPLELPIGALHCKYVNTELFKVIGNPLSSIEQPYLLILHALYKFDTRYHEQCAAIAVNLGDEDIILNKGMTLCFIQETDVTTKIPHIKEMDTVNIVEDEDMKDTKRERHENCLQEISLNYNRKNCHKILKTSTYTREFSSYVSQGFLPET